MIDNRLAGKRITELRHEMGLTQQQLSAAMNVSHQAVSKWESGAALPDVQTLLNLSGFFGVSLEYLLGKDENAAEDIIPVGPVDEKENETMNMNFRQLIQMAPFMNKETVGEIAMNLEEKLNALQLARIAPFVPKETLAALLEKNEPRLSWDTLRRITPFLPKDTVDHLAHRIASGQCAVDPVDPNVAKTFEEIGKTFEGIGNDVGKAMDDFGKGVEKVFNKVVKAGGDVISDVTEAINNASVQETKNQIRSQKLAELRRKAFEKALEELNWTWLAAHISELDDGDQLKKEIAEKAVQAGRLDWVETNIPFYACVKAAADSVREDDWDGITENLCKYNEEEMQFIKQAAVENGKWEWLSDHHVFFDFTSDGEAAVAEALEDKEYTAAARIAAAHLPTEKVFEIFTGLLEKDEDEPIDALLECCDPVIADMMLIKLAEKDKKDLLERHICKASGETLETMMEKAVEEGNFDIIDTIENFISCME